MMRSRSRNGADGARCFRGLLLACAAALAGWAPAAAGQAVWLEAEAFAQTGGWANDAQFVDLMGSPYLLATGVGRPATDAVTQAAMPAAGDYTLWVRCKDWRPPHAPGRFQVLVGGRASDKTFGQSSTDSWQWVEGGQFKLPAGPTEVRLHDLTGWWGRCDAVVLAAGDFKPANEPAALAAQREQCGGVKTIAAVQALDVRTNRRLCFAAPLFIDCTGHGWVGFWAGADFRMGEEARSEYNEPDAPAQATRHTMGNDLYAAEILVRDAPVAFSGWGMDIHHPEGFWVRGNDCMHYFRDRKVGIPFRSLYSRNIGNLLMAGRCHSATHLGMGGTRIMRTCCEMGEATGVAAALAAQHRTTPRGLGQAHIAELQQALLKDGCYLPGVPNRDPADLALQAKAGASSFAAGGEPGHVIDGWNRAVGGVRHAWVPDLAAQQLPQWIELALPAPAEFNRLHVSFQTRLSRGVDFDVEAFAEGGWKPVAEVRDNAARRRVLAFAPVRAERVRLVLKKVAGQFGVCELRLYRETP